MDEETGGRGTRETQEARSGRGVDDRAAALRLHQRERRQCLLDSPDVHIDGAVEVIQVQFTQIPAHTDAGVVEDRVDATARGISPPLNSPGVP